MTLHLSKKGYTQQLRIKRIFSKIDIGVVHTEQIKNEFCSLGISNIRQIEYPNFTDNFFIEKNEARKFLGIRDNITVLAAVSGTRENKGLDILLEALNDVKEPFVLLIAGSEQYFSNEFTKDKTKRYSSSVKLIIKYLSDEEMAACIVSSEV